MMKNSFKYALAGIMEGWRNHPNFRRQMVILSATLTAGWWYKISRLEWVAVILASGLMLAAEMANTAIEATVDLVTREKRPEAKIAKDAAAGGVLVTAVVAVTVGAVVFLPKIWRYF
jgi:undecaprenol kinase